MSASNLENEVQDALSEALLPRGDQEAEDMALDGIVVPLEPQQTSDVEALDPEEGGNGNRVVEEQESLLVDAKGTVSNPILSLAVSDIASSTVKWFLPEASGDSNENNASASRRPAEEDERSLSDLLDIFLCSLICFPYNPFVKSAATLALSVAVLQASYLWWGYMQELVMTTQFSPTDQVPDGKFPSAAFCVWVNRLVAVIASSVVVFCRQGLSGSFSKSPLRAFSPIALSNTLGSFSQYASLRSVSFPVMMISKSLTIVSVMIVGTLLNGTRYAWGAYVEAVVITSGVCIFSIARRNPSNDGMYGSQVIGYLFISVFLFCNAFTAQWQRKIYEAYGRRNVDPFQMMMGVNVFSIALTSMSMLLSGEIDVIVEFLKQNPVVIQYLAHAAAASSIGQLCVFFVIREYGPVVFTIVMTTRQMMAMVISSILFGHTMSVIASVGAMLVFTTVALQIRRNYSLSRDPEVLQE